MLVHLPSAAYSWLMSAPMRSSQMRPDRRRNTVQGRIVFQDGREMEVTEELLRAAPEAALRALSFGLMALAAGLVIFRLS